MRAVMRIRMRPGRTIATLRRRGRLIGRGSVDSAEPEAVEELIEGLMAGLIGGRFRPHVSAVIEMLPPLVQVRRLRTLPPVSTRDLKKLIAGGADRFFRMNGEAVVTNCVWVGGRRKGRAEAFTAAIPEGLATALVQSAAKSGLRLEGMVTKAPGRPALNLLPPGEVTARARRMLRLGASVAAAGASMWIALAVVSVAGLIRERESLATELARLEPALASLRRVDRELAQAEAAIRAVRSTAQRRGRTLATLAAVTKALPDSTYLESFSVGERDTVRVAGTTRLTARLVAAFDEAAGLAAPHLEGTPLRTSVNGRSLERFSVSLVSVGP